MHTKIASALAVAALIAACAPPDDTPEPLVTTDDTRPPRQSLDSAELPKPDPSEVTDPPPPTRPSFPVSKPPPPSSDASAPAPTPPKKDVTACISACEAKYPGGTQKSRMIDKCWADHCDACQGLKPGGLYSPAYGSCQTGVYTWSASCSTCTTDWCCWAWDMCFQDTECKALNACTVACSK